MPARYAGPGDLLNPLLKARKFGRSRPADIRVVPKKPGGCREESPNWRQLQTKWYSYPGVFLLARIRGSRSASY
jgi:hypothetical protein